ncbi:MFS general substrate transporter [Lepidopterella palustris CBS 459.81]|uniref:MFS general substrate transporter n=1 Tax=Lepidopterella palustris CBS 459.81 TaxID=1314670 RepID=A0A8E2DWI7_9PEZI|nr:MFS general substrate transporter [Lepidopterella palustris CBS 459.81]
MDEVYELQSSEQRDPITGPPNMDNEVETQDRQDILNNKTVRKLDLILLPFLALLFLFNSLDKSNIGNAESAHFTSDIGLEKEDLNTAVALFFAFFVTLQPLGAALGRRYGMVIWVPSCMAIWGICTALHVWVRSRWQLFTLRIIIGCLEAGFYPVTVSYLSLFYTRFEFARRLSLFYGQAAVAGALGGVLSYFVFSQFAGEQPGQDTGGNDNGWRSWQVLFLLEGGSTVVIALTGFLWLPHSAKTAWFLSKEEREWAEERIRRDRTDDISSANPTKGDDSDIDDDDNDDEESRNIPSSESHGLLNSTRSTSSSKLVTDDRGLTPHDILSALLSPKIYHLLACNILSSIPVTAFSVFLPLVLAPLTSRSNDSDSNSELSPNPALTNLLTAPPYVCGAITLYLFASYSDRHRIRLGPILAGLCLLLAGLILVVLMPQSKAWAIPRYLSLNILLSGTFIASPLTVAWIAGNTPSPGKRALLLGINGWGNLAGVFSALLFQPKYEKGGYVVPFWWTLGCVGVAAAGYVWFWRGLVRENESRERVVGGWDRGDVEAEKREGKGPVERRRGWVDWVAGRLGGVKGLEGFKRWVERAREGGREGDEKVTFLYGL